MSHIARKTFSIAGRVGTWRPGDSFDPQNKTEARRLVASGHIEAVDDEPVEPVADDAAGD